MTKFQRRSSALAIQRFVSSCILNLSTACAVRDATYDRVRSHGGHPIDKILVSEFHRLQRWIRQKRNCRRKRKLIFLIFMILEDVRVRLGEPSTRTLPNIIMLPPTRSLGGQPPRPHQLPGVGLPTIVNGTRDSHPKEASHECTVGTHVASYSTRLHTRNIGTSKK